MTDHPFDTLLLPGNRSFIFTPCPGTKETTIKSALNALKQAGADAVVTLLSDAEIEALSVTGLGDEAEQQGLLWIQLPIEDDEEPGEAFQKAWEEQKETLFDLLSGGKTMAIHCRGGSGRTGLMAAILLMESGGNWQDVKSRIQSVRPKALSHPAHISYVKKHYSI